MSVFTRAALEGSPLADLHTIAGEIGLDGFRRLRKADLVDKILDVTGGDSAPAAEEAVEEKPAPRARRSRSRATRDADPDEAADADADAPAAAPKADADADDDEEPRRPRRSRGGRGRGRAAAEDAPAEETPAAEEPVRAGRGGRSRGTESTEEEQVAEGVVEVLGNGSGFLRVSPPDPSDDDVYISAAQVRRCELVSGDRIAGPVRPPRRSERYPSLVRIDKINDRPADEVAEGTPFDELPATFPTERFALGSDDATLTAIEWLTPIGRGSRVTITGASRAGKTETLQRLAGALAAQEGVELSLVLVGVRPEETQVAPDGITPVAGLSFAASADAQGQAVERAIDAGRRVAARGGHALVLIDSLNGLHPTAARKALAAARAITGGGTLTVIATSTHALGGETTVIALDEALTSTGRLPALDLVKSGTVKLELLVGEDGAKAVTAARASALEG
ncbi:Rho termination factor N-terminal domain-containing protein [Paraconexibacter antarcticus]|uniref:Rho termination factor N-terminal domain-containing protein n=1 Tax=Paraconexibacter antarcticus TaxID=2949664 RepID=A0ABY5DMG9_9ACTN|nr:Rho termination factor N-terminal domain-containing protein [Paraconexibacter antarcticus]UTI63188.1 Rho termination factor N-terminal domain-containing protein [Paraconexibacter antarcticus]